MIKNKKFEFKSEGAVMPVAKIQLAAGTSIIDSLPSITSSLQKMQNTNGLAYTDVILVIKKNKSIMRSSMFFFFFCFNFYLKFLLQLTLKKNIIKKLLGTHY
jgi:hypothetical protein